MKKKSPNKIRPEIIVALIGLLGVIAAAFIANIDKWTARPPANPNGNVANSNTPVVRLLPVENHNGSQNVNGNVAIDISNSNSTTKRIQTGTLVIDKLVIEKAGRTAPWYICFNLTAGNKVKTFNPKEPFVGHSSIDVGMQLDNIRLGQTVSIRFYIDHKFEGVCNDRAKHRMTDSFNSSLKGIKTFKDNSDWPYTIEWHMEGVKP